VDLPVLLENRIEILRQAAALRDEVGMGATPFETQGDLSAQLCCAIACMAGGGLTGRIKGSILYRMSTRSLSANQLAALSALIATPATKAKASITLSGNLLKVIDSLAGAAQRSAWIERAVQSYAARQLKERRRERELALLNRHADALNAEGDDSASYQANWTAE
jgi:hypothetical protein